MISAGGLQTISQLLLAVGIVMTALGGFGAYHFGKIEDEHKDQQSSQRQRGLEAQIAKLQSSFDTKTDLIFQALKVKQDVWIAIETKTVPPTSAYLLLLFRSDKGRIIGKVRVKGSDAVSNFSTTANDAVPVAVPNLWLPKEREYKMPVVVEFAVTEKTVADASLSIFTHGWIDDLGQEPH
jgi:hypothetical protein